MTREDLQKLAKDRVDDATALISTQRWSAAYHLIGYALECGLKSCVLAHVQNTGMIFRDRIYLKNLADCWTHDLDKLVQLAGLTADLGKAVSVNTNLQSNWLVAKDWKETSRYEEKTEVEARELFEAITNEPDGVLSWIRMFW